MAVRPLRPATDRRLGEPLPRQLPNRTRGHPVPPEFFTQSHAASCAYAVLAAVSGCYPPVRGRFPTRYSPVRRSVEGALARRLPLQRFARLACVKHAASVHPEPGSNSQIKVCPVQNQPLADSSLVYCLGRIFYARLLKSLSNFQGCLAVQLSRFWSMLHA